MTPIDNNNNNNNNNNKILIYKIVLWLVYYSYMAVKHKSNKKCEDVS